MADLPPLAFGKVVGRFLANIADGPDIGDGPEFLPLQGTLKFTAGAPKVLVATAEPDPATYVQLPEHYVASLDEFGYLTWRGERGIRLVAPNADTNPAEWTWRVDFNLTYEGAPVAMPSFSFIVPEYIPGPDPEDPDTGSTGLVDLTLASPVPASNGEAVVRGLSVVDVNLVGDALVFVLDNGESLDPVTVPQLTEATNAAAAAASSASEADASADAAAAAVNSFDLNIGTVTEGPAAAVVSGGPPVWTLDLTLPPGPTGPAAPDATASVKGIIQLAGDLGGTAAAPTVPGLAGKAPTVHTHPATDITDSSAIGRSVLTAATQAAARSAIGAGTSSLTLGTTAGTACAGDDARLSDARPPAAGTVPYDLSIVVCGKDTVRAAGAGDFPFGIKLQRAITVESLTVRANTADASGNLVVELRKNGAAVAGTSTSVAAANQVTGGTTTGTWAFAAGDILLPYITGVGTTPGKGLIVDIKARA
ncbi:hypothetical protein [Nocardia cyriacigeorgica]|uniref:hypothetical protein n=1 Tax=Nocardia cyriacigeorgica TaxID=135487 RepID=UPI002455D26A|nr:hypothetical protein [Nocardia cyriacigeorgica]